MSRPLISIIIPVYNRADLIKRTIDSVINQTFTNWECVIVDDGSTDNTLSVLQKYRSEDSRIHFYTRNRLPKGAPTCRNIGLNQAKGSFIIFLDSDDYLLPFCLKQRLDEFEKYKHFDFLVFPQGELKNGVVKRKQIPPSEDYLVNFLSADFPWSIMCPIWQREFLKSMKGFAEGYPRFNDPELMIRALLNTKYFKVLNIKDADCVYIPSIKTNIFTDKVKVSLKLLIPDVINYLKQKDKLELRQYLMGYLYLWFRYIYKPSNYYKLGPSLEIISIFRKYGILSSNKSLNLMFRLFLFSWSSKVFKRPIDKLTHKYLYQ